MTGYEGAGGPCERYGPAISELIDGTLDAQSRAALARHLEDCPGCRGFEADLRRLGDTVRGLDRRAPAPDAWARLEARLRSEGLAAGAVHPPTGAVSSPANLTRRTVVTWRLAAAAAVIAIAAAITMFWVRNAGQAPGAPAQPERAAGAPAGAPGANAQQGELVESIEAELKAAEEHYTRAIARLEQIATSPENALDPQIAETLKANMSLIDSAITESRAALGAQPESAPAQQSLFEALRRKVALLQDTIVLVNEMRKGNEAEAARIVEGLSKS
jgi:hypothetical protein